MVAPPLVSPILIGRDPQRAALLRCLDAAATGHGQTVLVAGEAGIGKTRLVAEGVARATARGALVLQGNCFEPDRALPYAPLLDLLRGFLLPRPTDEIASLLGDAAPELAHLLPELIPRVPDLVPSRSAGPEPDQRRLFHALTRFVVRLAADRPLVVVAEDVHWSDEASLDFFGFLARRIAARPILLALTYRSDEVTPSLGHLLAELDRGRLATEIQLGRLSREEVDALLRAILRREAPLPPVVPAAIHELTEGNPFFVEEVLKSLPADALDGADAAWSPSGAAIPRTVRDAVRRRTARLPPEVADLLALAAIAGRSFGFGVLQELTGWTEAALLAAIKELIAAGLVVEESADRFAFRHALTRQAVAAELLARERRALHRRVAEAIERRHAGALDPHLGDLGAHWFEAAEWEKALAYAGQAGEAALTFHAPRAAIAHFTRALDAAHRLARPDPPSLFAPAAPASPPIADLHHGRGRAYDWVGEFERARADYERALRLAEAAGDRRRASAVLLDLGLLWAGRDYARAGDFYRRAVGLAEELADPRPRAGALNRLGNWLANTGRGEEAVAAHEEALALFAAAGDERGAAESHDLLAMTHFLALGDPLRAVDHAERAIDRFRAMGDRHGLVSSLTSRAVFGTPGQIETLPSPSTTSEECLRFLDEASRLARDVDWPAGCAYAEFVYGEVLVGCGRFGEALAHTRRALRIAAEIGHQQWQAAAHCILGQIHVAMLAPDPARRQLEAALALAHGLHSAWWSTFATAYLALAHLIRGDAAGAEAALAAVMPPGRSPRHAGERRPVWVWGEVALASGNPAAALRVADDLIASAPGPPSAPPIPALLKLRGEALLALRRPDEAAAALEAARRGAEEREEPPLLWQVRRALARLHLCRRQPAAARREAGAARDVIAALAATIDDAAERDRFARAALATLPAVPKGKPPSARRAEAARFGGLTPREREVAAQIGFGKSNREIAASLFVAEPTVASHVAHILAKLGLGSRAQVAVWARERGLTGSD